MAGEHLHVTLERLVEHGIHLELQQITQFGPAHTLSTTIRHRHTHAHTHAHLHAHTHTHTPGKLNRLPGFGEPRGKRQVFAESTHPNNDGRTRKKMRPYKNRSNEDKQTQGARCHLEVSVPQGAVCRERHAQLVKLRVIQHCREKEKIIR